MRRISAGTSGTIGAVQHPTRDLSIDEEWKQVLDQLVPGGQLRPIQHQALEDARLLDTRRNLVVCAPTNSGKSLVGYLGLLEALSIGKRALLLEPLRALAQEKATELEQVLPRLPDTLVGAKPRVILTTGDYRLENDRFSDAPPDTGEIIVSTPERLEAILRTPSNHDWASTIGCVVVDEAHLLGSAGRGPTLELVIATLRTLPVPPRLILLSATIGNPEGLGDWLEPCDVLLQKERTPPLHKEVVSLGQDEPVDEHLMVEIAGALKTPSNAVLVFVYQRSSADRLARVLEEGLKGAGVETHALAYHSGMSIAERQQVRDQFEEKECRCVVTTSALAMGINLPASHVFVRDTTFFGVGRLDVGQLLQIVGRAGRGVEDGHGQVLVRENDKWDADDLAGALRSEALPPLRSSFHGRQDFARRNTTSPELLERATTVVAACLSRSGDTGLSTPVLQNMLSNTLGGSSLSSLASPALAWLEDPSHVLAYADEDQRHHLTVLGRRGTRSMLPLPFTAGLGQLFRDLLSLDDKDRLLGQWTDLDQLVLASLLSDRMPSLRRFSERLSEQIDGWVESQPQVHKSVLFRNWISGTQKTCKADELFGSLGLENDSRKARSRAYLAMLHGIILLERSQGKTSQTLERQWDISRLGGIEESWRDTVLWLLAGQSQLAEIRCFYYHLREGCEADAERIQRVKKTLRRIQFQNYELQERLKYCSQLGPLLIGVRGMLKKHSKPVVGVQTIRRLESSGIKNLQEVAALDVDELVALGVRRAFAKQIQRYIRRRLR